MKLPMKGKDVSLCLRTLKLFAPFDKKSIHPNSAIFPFKPLGGGAWSSTGKFCCDLTARHSMSLQCLSGLGAGGQPFSNMDAGDNIFLVQSLIERVCV